MLVGGVTASVLPARGPAPGPGMAGPAALLAGAPGGVQRLLLGDSWQPIESVCGARLPSILHPHSMELHGAIWGPSPFCPGSPGRPEPFSPVYCSRPGLPSGGRKSHGVSPSDPEI